jgi:peptidyl-prolyl cis-trans isomerase B (cyclophilin B)
MQQNPEELQTDFNQDIKRLGAVIAIVAVAGVLLFKFDAASNSNKNNNQNMEKKITADTAYTITDPNLAIKPPTEEEVAKYNAEAETKTVVIDTTKGKIKVKLLPKDAPYTVASFMKLIDKGLYTGLIFHRVIDGFMIQGGDPSGNGTGGPGYKFVDEINPWSLGLNEDKIKSYEAEGYKYDKNLNSHKVEAGVIAMANSGPNTNGSQFFIITNKEQAHLNGRHTVFGKVIAGQDVADAISKVKTDKSNDMPLVPVKIKKVYLE